MATLTAVRPTTGNEPDAKKDQRAMDLMADAGSDDGSLGHLRLASKQRGRKPKAKGIVEKPVRIICSRSFIHAVDFAANMNNRLGLLQDWP
jgi:hypothetical protein